MEMLGLISRMNTHARERSDGVKMVSQVFAITIAEWAFRSACGMEKIEC